MFPESEKRRARAGADLALAFFLADRDPLWAVVALFYGVHHLLIALSLERLGEARVPRDYEEADGLFKRAGLPRSLRKGLQAASSSLLAGPLRAPLPRGGAGALGGGPGGPFGVGAPKRTRVVGVFPGERSLVNLATVVILRATEDWAFRRYLDMGPLWAAEGKPTKIAT